MNLTRDGSLFVGINNTADVSSTIASGGIGSYSTLNIVNPQTTQTIPTNMARWSIGCQTESINNNDDDLYFTVIYDGGTTGRTAGYIQDDPGGSPPIQMNFTGQHRCDTNNTDLIDNVDNYIGMIVESSGSYHNLLGSNESINNINIPTINEAQPVIELTQTKKSKKVLGVISNKEDKYKNGNLIREFGSGFVSIIDGLETQNTPRLFINSLGEGGIKVCNENGNIENGDLLCSSSITGIAMKQDDDIVRNYTIGKSTMDYNFINENDYKLIGCVYYCG